MGLLRIGLHAICCGGLFKVNYQLDQLMLLSSKAVNVVSKT